MSFVMSPGKDVFIAYPNGYKLHYQYGTFNYPDETSEEGYRYIWEYPDGSFHPKRGQTRIPSHEEAIILIGKAMSAKF